MRWDDLNMGDKSQRIKLAVDLGITDLRTIRDVYNSYAEGGHTEAKKFGPGGKLGPVSPQVVKRVVKNLLLRAIPEKYAVGFARNASNNYGTRPFVPLDELAMMGEEDLNTPWDPGVGFLLDRKRQADYMEKMGYHLVEDDDYGRVGKASRKLAGVTGNNIPIYQDDGLPKWR